jgi:nucleotide-binding universal stress UspA family protein
MLPIKTILHPTDFSASSDFAFRVASSLARDYGARLVIVHVALPPVMAYGEGVIPPQPEEFQQSFRDKLEQMQPHDPMLKMERRFLEGDPATEIVRAADETRSDVIVLGTHGRTGLSRLLMGSVAEKVVRRAPCAVLAVKAPKPVPQSATEPAAEMAGSPA